jgi:hypothetical protein
MKMNAQSRTFVKQVQADLLGLCDADLFHTIQQWVDGRNSLELSLDAQEDTRLALGYTHVDEGSEAVSSLPSDLLGTEEREFMPWIEPSPRHLRNLLAAMDANQFSRYVITLAYQSLHTTYPEWYEGLIFNAHLANYLRQIGMDQRSRTV